MYIVGVVFFFVNYFGFKFKKIKMEHNISCEVAVSSNEKSKVYKINENYKREY